MDDLQPVSPADPAFPAALASHLLDHGPVTVVGGPGTGKTRLLGAVHPLVESRLGSDHVLVLAPHRDHADVLRDSLTGPAGPSGADGTPAGRVRSSSPARSLHSYAFGIVSAVNAAHTGETGRFVSGADQDALLAELLDGYEHHAAERGLTVPTWSGRLTPEVRGTREFRTQLRDVLDRLVERDVDPATVAGLARDHGRAEWRVAAEVLQDYQDLLAVPGFGGIDTAGVLAEAAARVREEGETHGTRAGDRWSFAAAHVPTHLFVDAAQDFPDAALPLVRALVGLGTTLAVFGSPDTVTQGFRGAGGALLDAAWSADASLVPPGRTARIEVLDGHAPTARVCGAGARVVHDFARRTSRVKWRAHIPPEHGGPGLDEHLAVFEDGGEAPEQADTAVECLAFDSPAERSRHIARRLRYWHHDLGLDWADCAVITRSTGTANGLRQELDALGVPVAATDLPLAEDPATLPLLRLLALAPPGSPEETGVAEESAPDVDPERTGLVLDLLGGVYVGLDSLALAALDRTVRGLFVREGLAAPVGGRGALFAAALDRVDPTRLPAGLRVVARLLERAATVRLDDPHTALWRLWEATGVADEWEEQGLADPRAAANDRLDAVVRLFGLAEKFAARDTHRAHSFARLVLDQEFAQDSLARTADRDLVVVDSPAALAHREFRRVVVADVDEGHWPDPRVRGTIFGLDDLVEVLDGREPSVGDPRVLRRRRRAVVEDEAMVFHTALTRARERVVVTALDDAENSPSVFFHTVREAAARFRADPGETIPDHHERVIGGPRFPLSLREIAGRARAEFSPVPGAGPADGHPDPETAGSDNAGSDTTESDTAGSTGPGPVVEAWADLLLALRAAGVPEADPATWTGWWAVSDTGPLYAADETVPVRPSAVETFTDCGLRWFLTTHGGQSTSSRAQDLGNLVHAVAEHHPEGGLEAMRTEFETGFAEISFASDWERDREHAEGLRMIERLDAYLADRRAAGARFVAAEAAVDATEPDPGRGGPWNVYGRMDRLEVVTVRDPKTGEETERLRVVDYKTGKNVPPVAEVAENPQLGTYQVALGMTGAVLADGDQVAATDPGGGELVYLRKGSLREQPGLRESADPDWALDLVTETARGMRRSVFTATPSPEVCRTCPVRSSCPAIMTTNEEDAE
ncbi:PD-(D/E)XK nuclease family protein [Brevibacterium litoralis]|uniref:PD-(D/E)XK nuclease family protein n=1 Tax=Brevibacterium litoralis TaxID=3138935 RepID=UPI0032EB3ABC